METIKLIYLIGNILPVVIASINDGEFGCERPKLDYMSPYDWSEDSFYSPEMKKCVIPIDQRCWRLIHDVHDVPWSCPKNAFCISRYSTDICQCGHLHILADHDRSCVPGKLHGETCSSSQVTDNCATGAGLYCSRNVCRCGGYGSTWSDKSQFCVENNNAYCRRDSTLFEQNRECRLRLSDRSGENYSRFKLNKFVRNLISCPANSHLYDSYGGNLVNDTISYEAANSNVEVGCFCDRDLHPHHNGQSCLPNKRRGEKCDPSESKFCNENGLVCLPENSSGSYSCDCDESATYHENESICYSDNLCRRRFHDSFYDNENGKCTLSIFGMCNNTEIQNDSTNLNCPSHSICRPLIEYNTTETMCACEEGFKMAHTRKTCLPTKYKGEKCSLNKGDPCDTISKLTCLNGTLLCGCKEQEIWNTVAKKCEILVGQPCQHFERTLDILNYVPDCSKNSECKSSKCVCNEGYRESQDKLCLGDYLSKCEVSSDCHPETVCIDQKCVCPQPITQRYDNNTKSCVNQLWSECIDTSAHPDCPSNAECLKGICTCKAGFHETSSGECVLDKKGNAENCSGADQCDFTKGLACIEGRCACVDRLLKFDNGLGCVAPLGAKCGQIEPFGACFEGQENCNLYKVSCAKNTHCKAVEKGWSKCQPIQ